MAQAQGATSRRKAREARIAPTMRTSTFHFDSDDVSITLDERRVQRVIAVSGVSPAIARIIAPLAFGGVA